MADITGKKPSEFSQTTKDALFAIISEYIKPEIISASTDQLGAEVAIIFNVPIIRVPDSGTSLIVIKKNGVELETLSLVFTEGYATFFKWINEETPFVSTDVLTVSITSGLVINYVDISFSVENYSITNTVPA